MKKASSSKQKANATLDQSEWDFSKCSAEDAMACCLYEYARSSSQVRENVRIGLRTLAKTKGRPRYLRLVGGYGLNLDFAGFPNVAWLVIPKAERKGIIHKEFDFREMAFSEAPNEQPLGFRPQTGEEVCKVNIAWGNTPERIVEDFAAWVKDKHRARQDSITGEDVIWPQRLGRTAKRKLKALAAWRLLKVMKWNKAAELTEKLCGKPLFENQSAWLRAKKEAEQFLLGPTETE